MNITELYTSLIHLATEHASLLKGLAFGSLGFFILTPIAAPAVLVLMPADILVRKRRPLSSRPPLKRTVYILWHILKNLAGIVLILLGFLLLFLPGQGLLTLLTGTMLADVPGKRAMLRRILGAGGIRPTVDKLRVRHGRKPLDYPGENNFQN